MPCIEWAQRTGLSLPGKYQALLRAQWISVKDGRANWFIGQLQKQDSRIEEIK